jgi:hypothetical protein
MNPMLSPVRSRGVRCLRGQMPFRLECEPRFDFARQTHERSITSEGALFQANGQKVVLHGAASAERSGDGDVRLDFTLQAGEYRGFMLETAATRAPQPINPAEAIELFEQTVRLAVVAEPVHLPGPLAGDGSSLGHVAQADDLRTDRGTGRSDDDRPARAGGRRAQLGLPWLSTLSAMEDELVTDSLVYRYNPSASPDGLRGSEGTFRCARSSMSTLWPAPDVWKRHSTPSRRCLRTPTTSVCTRRRSTRAVARSATSPKRSPTLKWPSVYLHSSLGLRPGSVGVNGDGQPEVLATMVRPVFDQPDPASVRVQRPCDRNRAISSCTRADRVGAHAESGAKRARRSR